MARRLFLVELDLDEFNSDLAAHGASETDEFSVVEAFLPRDNNGLLQLLSSSRRRHQPNSPIDTQWSKAEFRITSHGWKLEKSSPREQISAEEYYDLLLSQPNSAVEKKQRIIFHALGRRYSLEMNLERNYAVIQIDYEGDYFLPYEELFNGFRSIHVVGELFMSLEETFCRLYLKQPSHRREHN